MSRKFQILALALFLIFSCAVAKAEDGYYFGDITLSSLDPKITLSVENDVWMQLYLSSLFSKTGIKASVVRDGEEIAPALILSITGNRLRMSSTSSKGISIASCYFAGFGTEEWRQKFPIDVVIRLGGPGNGQFIHPPKPEADDVQAESVSRFDSEPQELIITVLGPNF